MNTSSNPHCDLVLVFTAGGQAVLEEDGDPVWASDDDDDFREEFGHDFLEESDTQAVLEYLIEEDVIDATEGPLVAIEVESYEVGAAESEVDDEELASAH